MNIRRTILAPVLAAGVMLGSGGVAGATADAVENRLAGRDRFDTARAVAEGSFDSATVAIVANGRTVADALAASYLSGLINAPILLTEADDFPEGVFDTLEALGVDGVQIVGGSAAVSGAVAVQIEGAGYTVDRLAGEDRYGTAAAIARVLPKEAVGVFGAGRAAILASGTSFADALAAGPVSAFQNLPILLTEGGSLNPHARAAFEALEIDQVLIVGGTAAVSETVAGQVNAMGIDVRRVAGTTRQGTAARVAELARGELEFAITSVMIARGDVFADALAGGPRGGRFQAPILLTQGQNDLGAPARQFIAANSDTIASVDILGGTGAVSQAVANDAVGTARS